MDLLRYGANRAYSMLDIVIAFFQDFIAQPDLEKYISIPLIAAAIGWGTNWLAIKLTFWPSEFIGIKEPWLGWQGIIPKKVEKMSNIVVDQTLSRLGSLQEFFHEMEPEKIAAHMAAVTNARIEEYTDEVMREKNAVLWENMPVILKNRVYGRARRQIPKIVDAMMEDIGNNIEELVDLKHMIISQMTSDKELLNRVFTEVGQSEFNFVIRSGLIFGLPFGIVQMFVWFGAPNPWILPIFGVLVGALTNFLALNLIFQPLYPRKILGITFQGRFLKRQKEVAEVFCRIVTTDVMTVSTLMNAMLHGPKADRAKQLIKRHLKPFIEGGVVRTLAQLTVGPSGYVDLKRSIEEKAFELSVEPFEDPVFNRDRGVIVEKLFRERMESLSPEEFQDLLRPAFQEDEWILIAIGGALGFVAGVAQLFWVFGQTF